MSTCELSQAEWDVLLRSAWVVISTGSTCNTREKGGVGRGKNPQNKTRFLLAVPKVDFPSPNLVLENTTIRGWEEWIKEKSLDTKRAVFLKRPKVSSPMNLKNVSLQQWTRVKRYLVSSSVFLSFSAQHKEPQIGKSVLFTHEHSVQQAITAYI